MEQGLDAKYLTRRLLLSRLRILERRGFYGLLLMHVRFALNESLDTAATDGDRILFSPQFLRTISDRELDFVMMHEIMHIALRHCARQGERDNFLFNVACDIVVNSNLLLSENMDLTSITLAGYGESMHIAPDGEEGYLYTAEQVYEMLFDRAKQDPGKGAGGSGSGRGKAGGKTDGRGGKKNDPLRAPRWDDHSLWGDGENDEQTWAKRISDAAEAISVRKSNGSVDDVPLGVARYLKELKRPRTDWRTLLNTFIQEEVVDYTFAPPDRRTQDSPFFLPDFCEPEERVDDVLFMVDTSASMTDDMVAQAYSEIAGAIEQFHGRLRGMLGFFDAAVYPPVPFEEVSDLKAIRPRGGGGTSFFAVFAYLEKLPKPPSSLVILTDGYANFPPQSASHGVPVIWLINNEIRTPPWGRVARIPPEQS